jgi:hypothetical protein
MPTNDELQNARAAALNAILESNARLKLVVAGPGTGKTFTFQKLVAQTAGRCLVITFLQVLVKDLEAKFGASADVYSFHSFSRKLLHQGGAPGVTPSVAYYTPLLLLYSEDIRIIDGALLKPLQIGGLFRSLADDEQLLHLALSRGGFYNAVSHDDAVYRVLRAMERNSSFVPAYAQIVVDEFQDFCPLEVAFIKQLFAVSPTLIVGDDDQALYAFRDASPDAIRELAEDETYTRFPLPYCTRCTEVLVKAAGTVVERALAAGLLQGRLDKPFECYMPDKEAESQQYPKIRHFNCSTETARCPYVGRIISEAIRRIPAAEIAESREQGFPTVLIIGPNPFLSQVEDHLRGQFPCVHTRPKQEDLVEPLYAYRLLGRDPESNLGWRILMQVFQPDGWEDAVRSTHESGVGLKDALDSNFTNRHLELADILRRMIVNEDVNAVEEASLAVALAIAVTDLEAVLHPSEEPEEPEEDSSEPTIWLTSLMGSKGLQAGHVFIVGVNAAHFPRNNAHPSNEEVCQLLVALTRARKSCTLVSTRHFAGVELGRSIFLDWLRPHLATTRYVDRAFFDALAAASASDSDCGA